TCTIMQRIWTNNGWGVICYRLTNFGDIANESSRVGHDYQYVIEPFVLIVVYSSPYAGLIHYWCYSINI
ncbi:MAG: hypothetical protein ACRD5B_01895, partial [Nitrososphaeraceae archaeon]